MGQPHWRRARVRSWGWSCAPRTGPIHFPVWLARDRLVFVLVVVFLVVLVFVAGCAAGGPASHP